MSNLDGLAMLGKQREQASSKRKQPTPQAPSARTTLKSRHPAPKPTARALQPAVVSPAAAEPTAPAVEPTAQVSTAPSPRASAPLVRSTLYVDAELDTWLEEISSHGRMILPRVDVSRSAIVRYALQQLQASMTTRDVFDEIATRASGVVSQGGRKRV